MESSLEKYSQRFLAFIEREAPELRHLMRPIPNKDGTPTEFLKAEIVATNRVTAVPLWITTDDDEVTVSFDTFHAHFGDEGSEDESFANAVALVRDLLAERVSVASWWKDGKWMGSRLVKAGHNPERPSFVDSNAVLRVRSWSDQRDPSESE